MVFSNLVSEALALAVETHWTNSRQYRKGKDIPYIVHPMTVALILASAGADDEVVAAGLLHDTVEDSDEDHSVSVEMLRARFGDMVATLVESVTEADKREPWEVRKATALSDVGTFTRDSVLLKSADVVANDTELLADIAANGASVFDRFNVDRETLLHHKLELSSALITRWPDSPLAPDLQEISGMLGQLMQASH